MDGPIGQRGDHRGLLAAVVALLVAATLIFALLDRHSNREEAGDAGSPAPAVVVTAPGAGQAPSRAAAAAAGRSGIVTAGDRPRGRQVRGAAARDPVAGAPVPATAKSGGKQGVESIPAGVAAKGACPAGLSRSECKDNIEASTLGTPSYPVSEPSDCLDGLSQEQCEELFAREKEATAGAGPSYAPEECLRVYSREQCAGLAEEIERQEAAAQQAGD